MSTPFSNFFAAYKHYTEESESPTTYHLFSSLVALSSVIGRKVWLDMGYFRVFPNLYVILVGPAGVRKSSALVGCKSMLTELDIPYIADSITKQKLTEDAVSNEVQIPGLPQEFAEFSSYTPVILVATELSELVGPSAIGMTSFLTSIYDEPRDYSERTKNKGNLVIKRPYFNLLACTTPDWITTYMRQDIIGGGFSRRVLFVYEHSVTKRIALPRVTPSMQAGWAHCLAHARRVQKVFGPFTFTPEAQAFYVKWYETLRPPSSDPVLLNYYNSKHIQFLKVAMLVSLGRHFTRKLELDDLETALAMLDTIETDLPRVFEGVGRNDIAPHAPKVIDAIKEGTYAKADIDGTGAKFVWFQPEHRVSAALFRNLTAREFDDVLKHLIQNKQLLRLAFNGVPHLVVVDHKNLPT